MKKKSKKWYKQLVSYKVKVIEFNQMIYYIIEIITTNIID